MLAEGHGWERWGNFPLERQRLFDTIRGSGANGVVLLSGDRHFGALYREAPLGRYPLYEITSSGLNMVVLDGEASPGPIAWARLQWRQISAHRHRLVGSDNHPGGARRKRQRAALQSTSPWMNCNCQE